MKPLERSSIVKQSVRIGGKATSISLEPKFWQLLKRIAEHNKVPMKALLGEIDAQRTHGNMSSAVRVFVLEKLEASL